MEVSPCPSDCISLGADASNVVRVVRQTEERTDRFEPPHNGFEGLNSPLPDTGVALALEPPL